MREALAHSDHDFVVAEHRRRRPAPRQRDGIVLGFLRALARLIVRVAAFPNRLLGGLVFALVVAIVVNALLLQHSRHPAPLFRGSTSQVQWPVDKSAQPASASQPNQDQIGQLLRSESTTHAASDSAAQNQPAPAPHPQSAAAPHPAARDAIGQLLTSSAPREVAVEEKPKTVLGVQRALLKLGFVVRPDGEMGAVTRRALEQYERDHGLSVDGRLTSKLLRRLSAETGISID